MIQHVAASIVMPSFRALLPEHIHAKDTPGDPEDVVTIVDKAAEQSLMEQLRSVVPEAKFVGEEAVSENPDLVSALSSHAPVWLIDPIDGTKNFARGKADFGVMLALVENGRTRASWMAVPAAAPAGYLVTAERGGGTRINDVRVDTRGPRTDLPRGSVHTRMMPVHAARDVEKRLHDKFEAHPSTGSAATEYLPFFEATRTLSSITACYHGIMLRGPSPSPKPAASPSISAAKLILRSRRTRSR